MFLHHRAKMNGLSSKAEWSENLEKNLLLKIEKIYILISPKKIDNEFLL